jgi:hypothetical protein
MSEHISAKLMSARWLWTVSACAAFLLMVVRRDLSNQEALQVISFIVAFYFAQRGQEKQEPKP